MKKNFLLSCALVGFSLSNPVSAEAFELGLADLILPAQSLQLVADSGNAAAVSPAESFVDKLAQEGIGFLGNAEMSDEARRAQFKKLLDRNFDMDTIARFSLGTYWREANGAQRTEYLKLFKSMIVDVYSARFSDYKGQSLEVRGSRAEGEKDVLVTSYIVEDNGSEVRVDWRVRKRDSGYKVVDVIVEGVSMALTQRSDFSSVIQRGGGKIDALLEHLRGA